MENALFIVDIDPNPSMPELTRKVAVTMGYLDARSKKIDITFEVRHFRDGVQTTYSPSITEIIDNSRNMFLRDEDFNYIPNPTYDQETMDETQEFLSMPAFDYMRGLLFDSGVPLNSILQLHIIEMVADGKLDL